MGFQNYVSEGEACQLAGITSGTLSRFVEAGYLDVETENDGIRLYSVDELTKVFSLEPNSSEERNGESRPPMENGSIKKRPSRLSERVETRIIESEREEFSSHGENSSSEEEPIEEETKLSHNGSDRSYYSDLSSDQRSGFGSWAKANQERSGAVHPYEIELMKLQKVNEVNELIIKLREKEIEELKQERNWLRQRVERLEEKGERDQILLLSETQLMKQLLIQQKESRFSLKGALQWLGLHREEPKPLPDRLETER